jgi:signal transduction histidine kinase
MKLEIFRSMRLQTAAIIIAGFVLSHVAGYLLYTQDRRDALLMTEALDIAERAAGVSRLLRDLPVGWREEVSRVSDSRAFRVWLSPEPPFESVDPTAEEIDLLDYLRAQMPRIAANEMRVRFTTAARAEVRPPEREDPAGARPPAEAAGAALQSRRVVAITISHGEGELLNFLGQINTPQSVLPEFLGVNIISAAFGIGLVAFWLVHRVTVPLTRLAAAAERLGRNIYAPPLTETGPREVATAAAAFNRMQRRLTRLIEGRTELLAAISHDLRTPITQMRLRTELMPESPERDKNLAALDEMEAIIATFLDYARAANESEERSRSDIGALVESLCADLADTGAEISCETEDSVVVTCKRLAVKRGVANLIENALNYGERAHVEVRRVGPSIIIRVDDDGPGIPEEDLDMVFTPFHRGEASRNRHTGGVGLGLSIAQAVAEDHGGEVRLGNRPEGGLRAEMILPAGGDHIR